MNASPTPSASIEALENELRKLRKINKVLMDRVERNMDAQSGNAFSLFQAAITLEGRVAERTSELTRLTQRLMHEIAVRRETERELLLAKAEAEQANLGKTRFLAAASHDLHQPLNAARLFLGALADEVSAGRPRELVGRLETALDSVSELIDALLDIAKLDGGAWTTAQSSFSIGPMLERLADEYGPQAASYGLKLRVVQSRAVVRTDRALLARVLGNLLSNAIRYTRTGRVLIGCRSRRDFLRIEVWDTGIGIPGSMLKQIFEEFRQVGPPPRRDDKGFGLGLAIVDRIARLLDLQIDVRSWVGRGSCFAVHAPYGIADTADQLPELEAVPTPGREFAGLAVACIENDPETLDALTALLHVWGCRTISEPDVTEPDLILADYHLDDGALGTAAVAALRERYGRCIPALVVSSDRSEALVKQVESLGCGFLAKPLRPAKLRAMISYVLGR